MDNLSSVTAIGSPVSPRPDDSSNSSKSSDDISESPGEASFESSANNSVNTSADIVSNGGVHTIAQNSKPAGNSPPDSKNGYSSAVVKGAAAVTSNKSVNATSVSKAVSQQSTSMKNSSNNSCDIKYSKNGKLY